MNTNEWTISPSLELPGFHSDLCAIEMGGSIYIAGGYNDGREHNELLRLDVTNDY